MIFVKEEELEGFGSLVKFSNGMMLLRLQTLYDKIEVGNFGQQKPHIGEVVRACDETEDVFNVPRIKNLGRFVALYL